MKHLVCVIVFLYSIIVYAKPDVDTTAIKVTEVHNTDGVIWGFDFVDESQIVYTLRSGKAFLYNMKTKKVSELKGLPPVHAEGQGGLLDVRVKPLNKKTYLYFTYSRPRDGKATTALGRAELKGGELHGFKTIFTANAWGTKGQHYGSRIEFDGDKFVFISVGDRGEREKAQDLSFHNGKILRINMDGSIPEDNPFSQKKGASAAIWTYGHRNPQGLARHPETNELWSTEMGPRGGDEINLIEPKKNYGWPEVTAGREYWGPKIGEKSKPNMQAPVKTYVPSISPSGSNFYTGKIFSEWNNNLFLGNLSSTHIRRVVLKDKKVVSEEELLKDKNWRIRNLRAGPDGFLYLSTDSGILARIETK